MEKRGIALDFLGWLLLALGVLVIVVFIYIGLTGKTIAGLEFIKNLFKWG
jgi:hypothetical protein